MVINLVLVHSGNWFPDHINSCIAISKKFNFNIYLILDKKFHNKIEHNNINLVDIKEVTDDRYNSYSLNNYNSEFRDGFFPRTSSRFILIDNLINKYKIKSCFHIENDIAIYSDLIRIQKILDISDHDTALILDNPKRCVPSLIWYKNNIASTRLANFIYNNNNLDDMKNLALYFYQNRNYVFNLPIVPFDLIDPITKINFGNGYQLFNSIFDGAAIGQYLYGIDKIHNSYQNTKGFVNETCIFDVSRYDIKIENNYPIFNWQNSKIKINNLHIHSKDFSEITI